MRPTQCDTTCVVSDELITKPSTTHTATTPNSTSPSNPTCARNHRRRHITHTPAHPRRPHLATTPSRRPLLPVTYNTTQQQPIFTRPSHSPPRAPTAPTTSRTQPELVVWAFPAQPDIKWGTTPMRCRDPYIIYKQKHSHRLVCIHQHRPPQASLPPQGHEARSVEFDDAHMSRCIAPHTATAATRITE